jgi:hypothetical protein
MRSLPQLQAKIKGTPGKPAALSISHASGAPGPRQRRGRSLARLAVRAKQRSPHPHSRQSKLRFLRSGGVRSTFARDGLLGVPQF